MCPVRRALWPLRWLPSTPHAHVVPPPATEDYRRRCAEVGALPAPSARYCRGGRRRRAVLCTPAGHVRQVATGGAVIDPGGTARASTCSSEHVFPPMPRPSPYNAHVLTPGSATRCQCRRCAGAGPPPRRPLDAVGHRHGMRRRAMRRCGRLGRRSAAGVTTIATGAHAGEHGCPWGGCHRRPTRACCRLRRRRLQAPRCRGGVRCLHQVRVIVVAAAVDAQCHVRPRGRVRRIATGVAAINAGAPARASACSCRCRGRRHTTRTCCTPGPATRCHWRRCAGAGPPRGVHSMRSAVARTCDAVRCVSVGAWGDEMPLASPQVPPTGRALFPLRGRRLHAPRTCGRRQRRRATGAAAPR
jgi:hypothetical protein